MMTRILLLSAAGLLFTASASLAAPSELQHYTDRAQAKAQALLSTTGLDFKAQPVSVRATVNPDGRLNGMQVVRSSGSRDTDLAVETVLRKIVVTDPPLGLTGGAVTLNVSAAPLVQAKAP
jgi:hypothetical protein